MKTVQCLICGGVSSGSTEHIYKPKRCNCSKETEEMIFRKVSVKERLPELTGRYVVFAEGQKGVRYCIWNPEWINMDGGEITHWLEQI
jgi:hypothetical protein